MKRDNIKKGRKKNREMVLKQIEVESQKRKREGDEGNFSCMDGNLFVNTGFNKLGPPKLSRRFPFLISWFSKYSV